MGSVIRNTSWILGASAFNKASSVVLIFVLSRHLGAADFGRFSFAFFYAALFSSIAEMGLSHVLIRRLRAEPLLAAQAQGRGLVLGLASTSLALALAWAGAFALGFGDDLRLLVLISSLSLVFSFRDLTFRWLLEVPFRAALKMRTPALLGMASELLGLAAVLAAARLGMGVAAILAVYVLSNVPGFAALCVLSFRELRPRQGPGAASAELLREALPIGLSNSLNTFYLTLGSIALLFWGGVEAIGYYALAFRLTTSLRIIPEAVMHSVYPLLSSLSGGAPGARAFFSGSASVLTFMALPLALGVGAASGWIAEFFGGEAFARAAGAIEVLIWATAFAFLNTAARAAFNAAALGSRNLAVSFVMASCSAALCFTLIPAWGLPGAAWALALTEAAGLFASGVLLDRAGLGLPLGAISRYCAAAVFMLACVIWLPWAWLQVAAGLAAYGAAAALLARRGPAGALRVMARARYEEGQGEGAEQVAGRDKAGKGEGALGEHVLP